MLRQPYAIDHFIRIDILNSNSVIINDYLAGV